LQVGNTVHHLVTFVVSIGISLYRGWKLALVLLALTPLIAIAGFGLAKIMTWGSKAIAEAYAKASVQSTQAIGNIRTVASFQAEPTLYDKYVKMLEWPAKLSIKIYTYNGMAGGFINASIFVTCAAALLT
jgi:ATP-binding cassette, subfamily B (MDR/TAP), member 1